MSYSMELERLRNLTTGMLAQLRMNRKAAEARFEKIEHAILELDAAFRAAGLAGAERVGSLPSLSVVADPPAPSADVSARISA